MSGSQIFFSVMDKDKQVITDLQEKKDSVKLSYIERYKTSHGGVTQNILS
jgi:hypothetical protein